MKTYVFGDIHSTGLELQELIRLINPGTGDRLISVGDCFDRGRHARLVWDLLHTFNFEVCLGNHELKMLNYLTGKREWVPEHYHYALNDLFDTGITKDQLIDYIQDMPLIIPLTEDCLVTHGGVVLENPFQEDVSANVYAKPDWWDKYKGDVKVIYGHLVSEGDIPRVCFGMGGVNSIGLDTGACHGFCLTAFCVEENSFYQYRSGVNHFAELKNEIKNKKLTQSIM